MSEFASLFNLQNIDLFSVGIAAAAIGIIGFVTFFNDSKNTINRLFLFLSLSGVLWSVFNYLSYQFSTPNLVIWLLRIAIFFAVWFSLSIFLLLHSFPNNFVTFSSFDKYLLLPLAVISAFINLTPLVFSEITEFTNGRVSKVANGPGIALFGFVVFFLVGSGIYASYKKMRASKVEIEIKQQKLVFYGIAFSSVLLIIFNFIFPAFLQNPRFVPLGAVFLFPFVTLTAYAIFKLHLFNIKVIATEVATFVLSIASFFEIVVSKDVDILLFRSATFLLVLSVGILLIKSVRKEVQQREQLQVLTEKLEKANQQLKILDQARAEFISMASHQLRTPPSSIKWYLASALANEFGPVAGELRDALTKLNLTNNSQISLIESLLNVSRIERGKLEFVFEAGDLVGMTQFTVDQLFPLAKEKGLTLAFAKPKTAVPKLMMDKEKLRQVINNMIDNGIKYTKKGGIEVSIEVLPTEVILRVKDTGKGMGEKEFEAAFAKYGRGKDSIKYSAGLGLGMYLAKVIVEQHNGKIWAESPGAGKGSTFAFTLPIKNQIKPTSLIFDLTKTQNVK